MNLEFLLTIFALSVNQAILNIALKKKSPGHALDNFEPVFKLKNNFHKGLFEPDFLLIDSPFSTFAFRIFYQTG